MRELDIVAVVDNLPTLLEFIDEQLKKIHCSAKVRMQIDIAVEEIFVNIASYAYDPEVGPAKVRVEVLPDGSAVTITFIDQGMPYDPLAKEDPDIRLSADERQVGGLGIFLVKKSMDDVRYEYINEENIFTIFKRLA